jgi:hypothetical protein
MNSNIKFPKYELPWPEPSVPRYKPASIGKWKCSPTPAGNAILGYFRPQNWVPTGWMFEQKLGGKWRRWMSLTPMELESHMPHIAAAKGTVVVAGLGMGMYLYNILRKSEVTRVIVLERDRDVFRLFNHTTGYTKWDGAEKMELILGDAFTYRPDFPVDFLYADIWEFLGDERALENTQRLQANIKAAEVGFWGQEWDYITYLMHREGLSGPLDVRCTPASYQAFCDEIGLPLVERANKRYPKLAYVAVTLQISLSSRKEESAILLAQALGVLQQDVLLDHIIQAS